MSIVNKRVVTGKKKLFGAKIRTEVLDQLKAYSEYVQQPLNHCVDRLLEFALAHDLEFQAYWRARRQRKPISTTADAWALFLDLGRQARPSSVTDASVRPDDYLYGPEGEAQ